MSGRSLVHLGFAAALLAGYGCSGGGSSVAPPPPAIGCADGGAPAPNTVALTCGAASDNETERVDVILTGPASGTMTLRGLNFDVTYDPFDLDFIPDATPTSPLFSPGALVAVALHNGQPGDIVISIQQYGGNPDKIVSPGENLVLSLTFRRVSGAIFGPTPLNKRNTEATNASTPVAFVNGLSLSYQ
jgi:hypothetical protein